MRERNDNMGLIGGHQTDSWLVLATLPGLLPAVAALRGGALHDMKIAVVVSALMMLVLVVRQARRAARGAK